MTGTHKFYSALAKAIEWYHRAEGEWKDRAEAQIEKISESLPYGSGFDEGSRVVLEKSTGDKIVIKTSFHHLNGNGYYDGWTEHNVIVTPSLQYGYYLKITGRNRNWIKDYIHEVFDNLLLPEDKDA